MTIAELIERLQEFPMHARVDVSYDAGCASGEIEDVHAEEQSVRIVLD